MRPVCLCFAIPMKAFRRLAERSSELDARAQQAQASAAARLRTARHACALETPVGLAARGKPKKKPTRTVYDVAGKTSLPGDLVRSEGERPTDDTAVNEAYDNAGLVLRFYREVFGRNSIDGRGGEVQSAVHFGRGFGNAMWSGTQMVYGDGNNDVAGFTGALDIIAHELTHGVVQHIVPGGLGVVRVPVKEREFKDQKYALKGQAGALNESLSDIVGSMVKQWKAGEDAAKADWLVGESIFAPHHGDAVRSLKDPGNTRITWFGDEQIRTMDEYHESSDPHDASGIPNHAFYLAARKIGGKSWEKAGRVWFDAYCALKPDSTFADAAHATCRAAETKFGENSAVHKAVVSAWKRVQVL